MSGPERRGASENDQLSPVATAVRHLTLLRPRCYVSKFLPRVPVSSRGQDTWFSATGPGFESPYRYHPSLA